MTIPAAYANDHKSPNGPGDARPNALKIIRDQGLDDRLSGKVFFITGCTAGIGVETARALHATGADVYFTGRDKEAGQNVVESLTRDGKPGKVIFIEMDLDSLVSVQKAAAVFKSMSDKLHGLICNAGVAFHPKATTMDGFEMHFGANHIGHFALFHILKDLLLQSATPDSPSRVVMVSSRAHAQAAPDFEDINIDRAGAYSPHAAYGASKTANIWMANELERRFGDRHLHANSVHPGGIHTRGGRHLADGGAHILDAPEVAPFVKSAEQGAATTVWAAVGEELKGKGGLYLCDMRVGVLMSEADSAGVGYAPHAFNKEAEGRLWELSEGLLKKCGMNVM